MIRGRKMRVDTTVVESNIHYPTDSGLLNDGTRVLTRTMKKIEQKVSGLKGRIRNRKRSVTRRVIAIAHALRHKGPAGEEKRKREYRELLNITRRILGDTRRVLREVESLPRRRRMPVRELCEQLRIMADRVRSVVRQTKARIFGGLSKSPEKIVSLFEPHTEIIRKGKAGKPNEFGKLVQLQEAENQIITHYEVYDDRPADQRLLIPALEAHRRKLRRVPRLVVADAGYYSQANEEAAQSMGVDYVSIPNRNTRSQERLPTAKAPMVQERPSVAHRMRGKDQYGETPPWTGAMPVSRLGGMRRYAGTPQQMHFNFWTSLYRTS